MFKLLARLLNFYFKWRFNKLVIREADIKPNHSYILMCNHFSFLDGFWAYYLCNKLLWKPDGMKRLFIMSLKRQIELNWWMKYTGNFSIEPRKKSMLESFDYAAEVLSEPGSLLLFFPQANLESCHVRNIDFQDGLYEIVTRIKGNCQLIWCSNIVEYFESIKPSVYMNMLDCGTNRDFNFEELKLKVNQFHKEALARTVRYTKEG
ncbi:lysophospholipid acyltransferase family protein [Mucilaginibacter hurinus]|nr:1-acyl-sn-glycerol-3-phosphate acyltransferase [Mucilaginibacter hurinus]